METLVALRGTTKARNLTVVLMLLWMVGVVDGEWAITRGSTSLALEAPLFEIEPKVANFRHNEPLYLLKGSKSAAAEPAYIECFNISSRQNIPTSTVIVTLSDEEVYQPMRNCFLKHLWRGSRSWSFWLLCSSFAQWFDLVNFSVPSD